MTAARVVGAVIGVGVLLFVAGWVLTAAGVFGSGNVRDQWRFAYDYDQSLRAIAIQVCTAEKAVADATSDTERTQRRSQLIAVQNNYARVAAEYNARLADAFRARLVRPPDVPTQAPALDEAKRQACP